MPNRTFEIFYDEIEGKGGKGIGKVRSTKFKPGRDNARNVGTIEQIGHKESDIKGNKKREVNLGEEYKTKGGKEYNATKVVKYPKSEDAKFQGFSLIACNAPTKFSIESFCDMIVTSDRIDTVVVLGSVEKGRIEDYWSNGFDRMLNLPRKSIYKIETVGSRLDATQDWIAWKVKFCKGDIAKEVTLYYYHNWNDKMPPTNKDGFEAFVKKVKDAKPRKIVAHCYAGVGRTGTFAACLDYLFEPNSKTPVDIVKQLRSHRTIMVQTVDQFDVVCKFIARRILEDKSSKAYKEMEDRASKEEKTIPTSVGWNDDLDYDLFFGAPKKDVFKGIS